MRVFRWSPGFLGYSDLKKTKQTKKEFCLSLLFSLINECLAFYNPFLKRECDFLFSYLFPPRIFGEAKKKVTSEYVRLLLI